MPDSFVADPPADSFVADEESAPTPAPTTRTGPLLGELYAEMHRVAKEHGIAPVQPGEGGFNAAEAATLNRTISHMIRKEAEERIASGVVGEVGRGVRDAAIAAATSLQDPATLALIGATAAAAPLAPVAPLTARALASGAVGTMLGLTAKTAGETLGTFAGAGDNLKLDEVIRQELGMTLMVAGTKGTMAAVKPRAPAIAVPITRTELGEFPATKQRAVQGPAIPLEKAGEIAGAAERELVQGETPVSQRIAASPSQSEVAVNLIKLAAADEVKRVAEAEGKPIEDVSPPLPKPEEQAVNAGLRLAVEQSVDEAKGGLATAEPTLDLLPAAKVEELAINELLRQDIERGAATQFVESLGDAIRRVKDYPRATAEKIAQQIAEGVKAMVHPDKPLTANQVKITYDALTKAITENRLSEERPGIISGTGLEKWADATIKEGRGRVSVGLDPVQLAAYIVKGAALLERGITNAAEWTTAMVKEYGNEIRPYLKQIRAEAERTRAAIFDAGTKLKTVPQPSIGPTIPQTNLLPDMLSRAESRTAATTPFGAAKIPVVRRLLGVPLGPLTPIADAIVTYAFERYGVGPAFASRFGNLIRGLDNPFTIDKNGDITNIGAPEGASRKISDVMESLQRDPDAYQLNTDQRAAIQRIEEIHRQFGELEQKYDIGRNVDDEVAAFDDLPESASAPSDPYFTRVVTERPKPKESTRGGQSVGSKQYFEKSRLFDTEAEGWQRGYKYEPSIERRLVTRAERLYKRISDKRLIDDAALNSRTRRELDSQLRVEYAEELADGSMTEERLGKIGDSIEASGRVYQPGFQGKIFDAETAQALNKALEQHSSKVRKTIVQVNNAAKTGFLGFDIGNLLIQLLPTAYKNPAKWAEAAVRSIRAFADGDTFAAYVRDNEGPVRELAELGSPIGRLPEFLAGFEKGQIIPKIPFVGKLAEAFGRQFTSGLDVAKVELWKAYREVTPREEWPAAVRAIEGQLLTGRMESAGISANRALSERAMLLAPAYYRGSLDLVGQVMSKGVSGSVARRSLGAYAVVGPALFLGVGALLVQRGDMTEEQLAQRMNPADRDFMTWRVGIGDKHVEVGFGGIYKSFMKLLANMVRTSVEHPENWKSLDPQKNPLTRWYRGHAAPLPAVAIDQITGRDFLGRDVDVTDVTRGVLPLAVQSGLRALWPMRGESPASPSEMVFSFLGLSAYTEPVQREFDFAREEQAKKQHGKDYEALTLQQQASIVRELNRNPKFKRPEPTSLQSIRAIQAAQDREERLRDGLTPANQKALEQFGLRVRGYTPVIRVGQTDLPLTEKQRDTYEAAIQTQYNAAIERVAGRLSTLKPESRQDFLDQALEDARMKARNALKSQPAQP